MTTLYEPGSQTIVAPQVLLGNHLKALKLPTFARVSIAETNCAKWRLESVPVWLREKGFEARFYFCVFLY